MQKAQEELAKQKEVIMAKDKELKVHRKKNKKKFQSVFLLSRISQILTPPLPRTRYRKRARLLTR